MSEFMTKAELRAHPQYEVAKHIHNHISRRGRPDIGIIADIIYKERVKAVEEYRAKLSTPESIVEAERLIKEAQDFGLELGAHIKLQGALTELEFHRVCVLDADGWPTQWQLIDTAPNDQRAILATHAENVTRVMHVCWRIAADSPDYLNPRTGHTWRPTHWQPLPTHPLDGGKVVPNG